MIPKKGRLLFVLLLMLTLEKMQTLGVLPQDKMELLTLHGVTGIATMNIPKRLRSGTVS